MARKRPARDLDDDDDDDLPAPRGRGRVDDDDEDDTPPRPSRNNAFTGLALLTTVALIGAAVFFYLDAQAATAQPLPAPAANVPALAPTPPAAK